MKIHMKAQPFTPQQVKYLREAFQWRVFPPGTPHDTLVYHMGQQSVLDFIEKDMIPEGHQQMDLEGV